MTTFKKVKGEIYEWSCAACREKGRETKIRSLHENQISWLVEQHLATHKKTEGKKK